MAVFQNLLSIYNAQMMLKMSARAYESQKCCPDSRLTRYWDRADICHLFVVYKNIGILNVLLLLLLESIETCIMQKNKK